MICYEVKLIDQFSTFSCKRLVYWQKAKLCFSLIITLRNNIVQLNQKCNIQVYLLFYQRLLCLKITFFNFHIFIIKMANIRILFRQKPCISEATVEIRFCTFKTIWHGVAIFWRRDFCVTDELTDIDIELFRQTLKSEVTLFLKCLFWPVVRKARNSYLSPGYYDVLFIRDVVLLRSISHLNENPETTDVSFYLYEDTSSLIWEIWFFIRITEN